MCKHFSIHTWPRYVYGRKEGVQKLTQEFPRVTRGSLIQQQVQNSLELTGFSKAVDTSKQFADTTCMTMLEGNLKTFDANSFRAVRVLQRSFQNEDKFLILDYNDGSDGSQLLF